MAQFDIESFRDYFLDLFQSKMAAKIAEINAEKGGSIVLVEVPAAQYFCDANEAVFNHNLFIYYGFEEINTLESNSAGYSEEIVMSFAVVIADPNDAGATVDTKLMRYTRALAEIVREQSARPGQISDIAIKVHAPATLNLNKEAPVTKIAGITITGVIVS